MKLFFLFLGANASAIHYDFHEITEGYWGDWLSTKKCPETQAICGVNAKISGSRGVKDDSANNALKFKCCDVEKWSEDQTEFQTNENSKGSWQDEFLMCDEGTFVTGMDAKLERKQGEDDDTAMGGVKIICDSFRKEEDRLNTHNVTTPWGSWVNDGEDQLETVKQKTIFCGARVREEEDQHPLWGDDTTLNGLRLVKCHHIITELTGFW